MNLIGKIVNGKPELDVDLRGSGKHILMPFGTNDVYGPFDSVEQAQEWWEAKRKAAKQT